MRTAASLALLFAAAPAFGQIVVRTPGVSPTLLPAPAGALRYPAPFAPGLANPFVPYRPFFAPAYPPLYGIYGSNFIGPRLGYGSGGFYSGYGINDNFGNFPVPFTVSATPPLQGTSPVVTSGPSPDSALTAQLAIEFPAEVELKIDGKTDTTRGVKTDAGVTRTVTTRALKPGETATVTVSAEWEQDGKPVEWGREVTLTRGETARLKVARGFPRK